MKSIHFNSKPTLTPQLLLIPIHYFAISVANALSKSILPFLLLKTLKNFDFSYVKTAINCFKHFKACIVTCVAMFIWIFYCTYIRY